MGCEQEWYLVRRCELSLGRMPALPEKPGGLGWRSGAGFPSMVSAGAGVWPSRMTRAPVLPRGSGVQDALPEKRKRWKQGEGIHLLLPACSQSRFLARPPPPHYALASSQDKSLHGFDSPPLTAW